jgi:hypothetical protein
MKSFFLLCTNFTHQISFFFSGWSRTHVLQLRSCVLRLFSLHAARFQLLSVCAYSARHWRLRRVRNVLETPIERRNVQSYARTHFPQGLSRTGSGVVGSACHPASPSVSHDKRQRSECFSRSNGPKTNYPPSWKLSRKYWKVRAVIRLEWPLFVSGATIRVRRAEQRFLTSVWPTNEIQRERAVAIKRIESVRMKQSDRSEKKKLYCARWAARLHYGERSTNVYSL